MASECDIWKLNVENYRDKTAFHFVAIDGARVQNTPVAAKSLMMLIVGFRIK